MSSTRYKVCSNCGAQMERRENVMTTSQPSLYIYDCPECGNVEYDINQYPCAVVCSETVDYKDMHEAALQTAKQWIADGCSDAERIALEAVFPELRESEDEKIREEMIRHFQNILKEGVDTTTLEDTKRWLAWLEKQKDSIPYEKYVMDIAAMSAEMRTKYSAGWNAGYETKQKEQKPIPLMNGDADLYFDDLRMATQHVLTSREWFEEGIKYAQKLQKEPETASASSIPSCWEEKREGQKPISTEDMPYITDEHFWEREHADSFKYKLAEYMTKCCTKKEGPYGYTYGLSAETILKMAKEELIKRGVVRQPKQEWSETDEKCLQGLMQHIEHCVAVYGASEPKWQQWLNLLKKLMEE